MLALFVFVVLFLHVLVLVPFHRVFIVFDGCIRDSLASCCAGMKPIHSSQQPVMTPAFLVAGHVILNPLA